MKEYILPILIFLGFGALSGILLLIASKVLAVKTDETEAKITEALPGANCGGCGYSGCASYAAAVAHDGAPTNLCKPGGAEVMKKINAIMGTEGGEFVREVAFVRCNGCENATKDRFTFTGTKSCAAVEKFYNGKGECRFGCDGYGDKHPRFGYPNSANDVAEMLDFLRVLKDEGFFDAENPYVLSAEVTLRPGEDEGIVLANTKRVLNRAWALLED